MSEFESAFLCGLIKKFRPKKLLEVGVSAGGTTPIILQCLEDVGQNYNMYSIDKLDKYYRDREKGAGFIAKQAIKEVFIPNGMKGKHEFLLGTTLPFVLDKIGGDIDFVMLDTTHSLPGETLEFLVLLPYLKEGAIVCMHDIRYCQGKNALGHATPVLFISVTADKFFNFIPPDNINPSYPNITAFQVNSETMKNIANVFAALILRWRYLPEENDFNGYRDMLLRYYPPEIFVIFQEAARLNKKNLLEEKNKK